MKIHEINSSEPIGDQDIRRYNLDGVILLRGFISEQALSDIEKDLADRIQLIESKHEVKNNTLSTVQSALDLHEINQRLVRLYKLLPESQGALYDSMATSPSLCRIAGCRKIQEIVHKFLSPVISVHHRRILLMAPPKNEWHLPIWHQDWFYNEGPISTMTLYAPLQRTTRTNGGLKIAMNEWKKGSLIHGQHQHGIRSKWLSIPPEITNRFAEIVEPELNRGDALLFNSLVPHSAQINKSDTVRMVINLRFQDLTEATFIDAWWRTGRIEHARNARARNSTPN